MSPSIAEMNSWGAASTQAKVIQDCLPRIVEELERIADLLLRIGDELHESNLDTDV